MDHAHHGGSRVGRNSGWPTARSRSRVGAVARRRLLGKTRHRAVNLTYYRLVFRSFYYTPPPARGDLPLPPHAAWKFETLAAPTRTQIGGQDYVAVPYHFWTYIVTDPAPPKSA